MSPINLIHESEQANVSVWDTVINSGQVFRNYYLKLLSQWCRLGYFWILWLFSFSVKPRSISSKNNFQGKAVIIRMWLLCFPSLLSSHRFSKFTVCLSKNCYIYLETFSFLFFWKCNDSKTFICRRCYRYECDRMFYRVALTEILFSK